MAVALALTVVSFTSWGTARPVTITAAAVLALASTIGFALQACIADGMLQNHLRRDQLDMLALERLVGYDLPRPQISTLGPLPLPPAAVAVMSALRWGFYLSLVGAVLLAVAAFGRSRPPVSSYQPASRWLPAITAALTVALVCTLVPNLLAQWWSRQATDAAANGNDASAVGYDRSALGDDNTAGDSTASPDALAAYGTSLLRLGPATGPAAQLASSRLQLQAGKDLTALQIISAAALKWPLYTSLREEFDAQSIVYLRAHGTPEPVRAVTTAGNDSAVLRIALARYELTSGDSPTAVLDARAAEHMAGDDDVRSVALTFQSLAQSRSGDAIGGRKTLLAAVEADHAYVNVMARSLLAGLYTSLPL